MKVFMTGMLVFLVCLCLAREVVCFPYRSYSPRSVPGRLRASSEPTNIKEYISRYLEMVREQQQAPNQQQHMSYGAAPDYDPSYHQGYISREPQLSPKTLAALLPYLSQPVTSSDYAYDYDEPSAPTYSDDGVWYDDEATPPLPAHQNANEEAALLQLFLDHLAGKYSLEDLETLERQAALEDNTENQLRALMPRKKSKLPFLGSGLTARNILSFPDRQGQKEEPLMIPAATIRKPTFNRSPDSLTISGKGREEGKNALPNTYSSSTTTIPTTTLTAEKTQTKNQITKKEQKETSTKLSNASTTMEPELKSAYEAFMAYLDQERFLRKTADEAKHSPQKRFVTEPKSLSQQLASLKKNVT